MPQEPENGLCSYTRSKATQKHVSNSMALSNACMKLPVSCWASPGFHTLNVSSPSCFYSNNKACSEDLPCTLCERGPRQASKGLMRPLKLFELHTITCNVMPRNRRKPPPRFRKTTESSTTIFWTGCRTADLTPSTQSLIQKTSSSEEISSCDAWSSPELAPHY